MTTAPDDSVFPSGHTVHLTVGEVLLAEGDEEDAAYLLPSGRCALSRGAEQVDVIDAGEFVGEISLFGGTP